jgi:protein gp37
MTKIEWVRGVDGSEGISWNALRAVRLATGKSAHHCEHVNEACRNCYAEGFNPRLGGLPFKPGHRKDYRFEVDDKKLLGPLRRKKATRIFVESMSDAFGEWWPREFVDKLYAVMALSPQHTFVNLSKRPERRREYLADDDAPKRIAEAAGEIAFTNLAHCGGSTRGYLHVEVRRDEEGFKDLNDVLTAWPLPNVIEGTSVSCQGEADEFVPILMATNAAVRAVSCEPLLGPIDLRPWTTFPDDVARYYDSVPAPVGVKEVPPSKLDWVIVGGESGRKARPMHPAWARSLRDQCQAAGVAYFFKQWGEYHPADQTANAEQIKAGGEMGRALRDGRAADLGDQWTWRVGKKAAGRLLDGREWSEFPATPPS